MPEPRLDAEISLRGIVVFGVALVGVMVVVTALMWWMSLDLRSRVSADDPSPAALPEARSQQRPEGPLLQADPIGELRQMRKEEAAILEHAAWLDATKRRVRLPIALAIDAVAQAAALPSTTDSAQPPTAGGPEDDS